MWDFYGIKAFRKKTFLYLEMIWEDVSKRWLWIVGKRKLNLNLFSTCHINFIINKIQYSSILIKSSFTSYVNLTFFAKLSLEKHTLKLFLTTYPPNQNGKQIKVFTCYCSLSLGHSIVTCHESSFHSMGLLNNCSRINS